MGRFSAKVEKPAELEITISATMTVGEWDGICGKLGHNEAPFTSACYNFWQYISETLKRVRHNVEFEEPKKQEPA